MTLHWGHAIAILLFSSKWAFAWESAIVDPLREAERLEALAEQQARCKGAGEPPATRPLCYKGEGSVLGLTEQLQITVSSYANGVGVVDVVGTGVVALKCKDRPLIKNGQNLNVTLGRCVKGLEIKTLKYCSDTDNVMLTVQQELVPIPVDATLARVNCSA